MPGKILVIDDEPQIARGLCLRLRAFGFESFSRPAAEVGIAAARQEHPDAILIDMRMPGMSGLEAIELMHNDPELRHIPVIMLSGMESDRQPALDAGAAAFLCKPYESVVLLELLESVLLNHAELKG